MSGITTCPKCQGNLDGSLHVHEGTLICPHCHASLGSQYANLPLTEMEDRDFRLGIGWGYWIILALISSVVLCIAWTCYAVPRGIGPLTDGGLFLLLEFVVLDLLVIIVCVWPVLRWMRAKNRFDLRWIPGFAVLVVGVAFATVVFFGFVCGTILNP